MRHNFIPDDLEEIVEDALLHDPKQREHDAMIAHIRLRRDPEELRYAPLIAREELRDTIRGIREASERDTPERKISQTDAGQIVGLSLATWYRLENLEHSATYLPSRTTLLKLAALCKEREWPEAAKVLEEAAGWSRGHKFSPRGPKSEGGGY